MALNEELKAIVDELEFDSDEERTAFEKVMEGKAGAKIQAGYMKNKDYTTKTQALAQAQRDFDTAKAQFDTDQDYVLQESARFKEDLQGRYNKTLQELSESRTYGAALSTKIDKLSAEYGFDKAELLTDVNALRAEKKEAEKAGFNYDDDEFKKRVVGRDEFKSVANAFAAYPTQVRDFEREYQRLFGKEYEGSLTELVNENSREVEQLRARGQNIDLFGHIRTKLDFDGQKQRNQEKAKADAAAEQEKWKEDTKTELERKLRSEILAENPNAFRQPNQNQEAWRGKLDAKTRQNQVPQPSAQDRTKHLQSVHAAYEERAQKKEVAA